MKRSLLSRLRTNGAMYLISAVLLILGVPAYLAFILEPTGFSSALSGQAQGTAPTDFVGHTYFFWIQGHSALFLGYRILLLLPFALILTLPFSLYRIIVAQEILGQQEPPANDIAEDDKEIDTENKKESTSVATTDGEMPAFAWRGKGFVVLATWLGTAGLVLYVLGTIVSTFYLTISSAHVTSGRDVADSVIWWAGTFTIITNMVGIGLLGLGLLFFGAMISRTGMNLWPGIWVVLGYLAILVGALLCIGAIAAVTAAGGSQGILNTVATFLFALWTFGLGLILTRLRPE